MARVAVIGVRERLLRFATVGCAAALLLFLSTWAFSALGARAFVAGIGGYALAFIFAYTLQHGWTFERRSSHRNALPRYLAVQLGCGTLAGITAQTTASFGLPPMAVSALTTLIASAASFILSMSWVFSKSHP